jgi:hypothetical protein
MGDWQSYFRSITNGSVVHPDARDGGSGRGHARAPRASWESSHVPHPSSPAARTFDWLTLPDIDIDERVMAVVEAMQIAEREAPRAILEATGEELTAILKGIIPGLLMCLCVVVATTLLGTVAGAAIGALAAGVGAAPGALFGAGLGLEAGLALLEGLGLAFLAAAIGTSLIQAIKLAGSAVDEAWHAIDDPRSRWFHVQHAGETLATALGVLMRGVLQGIVAFLLAKGANAAASRVPELVAKLRESRFGQGFAMWIERNWASLLKNERLQAREEAAPVFESKSSPSSGGRTQAAAPPMKPAAAPAEPAPPKASPPARPAQDEAVPVTSAGSSAKPLPKGPPNPNATARGTPESAPRASKAKQENLARQNDSADRLAREGYDIEHNQQAKPNGKVPDYKIDGEYTDHVNVRSNNVDQARSAISDKVPEQADRIVARLDDSSLTPQEVQGVLERKPVQGLKEVIFIKGDTVTSYVP